MLLNHFVVVCINVCTVKMAQLAFKSARGIMCPAGEKSHHIDEKNVFYFASNSFIELPESNLKFGKSKDLFNFYEHN